MNTTSLWRRVQVINKLGNAVVWGWEHVRHCNEDTADQWLARFQKDEPLETFVLAVNKPRNSR